MAHIEDCYRGFRESYLDYAALSEQLQAWAEAFPACTRLQSLGKTPEEREIWLLSIAADPKQVGPAVWVDGNMHAGEVAGSSAALAIAEAALRLHVGDKPPLELPDAQLAVLRSVTFHVCPRISPDGAEAVLREGGFVRSVPRKWREDRKDPYWLPRDIDGDGVRRFIRMPDPAGEFVESGGRSGLMLPRRIQDPPPYYRVYPEGVIENFDGHTIPEPEFLTDTTDLNRNFPWDWAPEPEQAGSGSYPGSEPESRAVLDWSSRHPELYAWLNLHTYGGVFIRPLGHERDVRMNRSDLGLYRQLGAWGEELVGYPTVSGYEEFTYEPEKPLHGDLTDYAYNARGCLALVCEIWDLFHQVGLPEPRPFVHRYTALTRDDLRKLADWDQDENHGRVFQPWKRHRHPQLGEVEIGGPDPRIGLRNPPPERLPGICEGLAAYWLRVAALLPRVVVEEIKSERTGGEVSCVSVTVGNQGYMPTWGLDSSRALPWNTPVYAEVEAKGCELVDGGSVRREVGHLRGWGRGLGEHADAPLYMRSGGSDNRRTLSWHVKGSGAVVVRVGSARVGWQEVEVHV